MFKRTIQNIETNRVGGNMTVYGQQQMPVGYNTQRYQRYQGGGEQGKQGVRKNISSGQFSQLKKLQNNPTNKGSQLVIRQCDPTELNQYKKALRPIEQNSMIYQGYPCNSSNKKQRIVINPRQKGYESNYKQPLEQIHYSDRDNKSERYSSGVIDPFTELQQQFEGLKQYLLQSQNQHTNQVKKLKNTLEQVRAQCQGEIENIASQVSREFNKQKEDIVSVNKRGVETQRELRHLKDSFNSYVKDNEEKMQSLVLEMNGNSNKKSKISQEFGVDLRSSSSHCVSGGVGTSMSVNFQNENVNLKLYNQTSAQLQMLKGELEQCKQKIQLLQKDTRILQLERKSNKQQVRQGVKQKIDLKEVEKMLIEKFSQERKKNSFSQKIQDLDLKVKDLYKVYQDTDSNIRGMNAEFTRVINGTVIKKQKMLEAKLVAQEEKLNELLDKTSPNNLSEKITACLQPQLCKLLERKSSQIKVIKVREPSSQERNKIQSVKNPQSTFLLDQEGYLIDAFGNYLIQTLENGSKQRLKIQQDLVYLLESQGLEISTAS